MEILQKTKKLPYVEAIREVARNLIIPIEKSKRIIDSLISSGNLEQIKGLVIVRYGVDGYVNFKEEDANDVQ